jgi:hypothetical protein
MLVDAFRIVLEDRVAESPQPVFAESTKIWKDFLEKGLTGLPSLRPSKDGLSSHRFQKVDLETPFFLRLVNCINKAPVLDPDQLMRFQLYVQTMQPRTPLAEIPVKPVGLKPLNPAYTVKPFAKPEQAEPDASARPVVKPRPG